MTHLLYSRVIIAATNICRRIRMRHVKLSARWQDRMNIHQEPASKTEVGMQQRSAINLPTFLSQYDQQSTNTPIDLSINPLTKLSSHTDIPLRNDMSRRAMNITAAKRRWAVPCAVHRKSKNQPVYEFASSKRPFDVGISLSSSCRKTSILDLGWTLDRRTPSQ